MLMVTGRFTIEELFIRTSLYMKFG